MPATTIRQSATSIRSADGQQPMQPGHADVVDPVDRRAVDPRGQRGLGGDGSVRRAGREDGDRPVRGRERTERGRAGDVVDERLREGGSDRRPGHVVQPRGQDGPVGMPLVQRDQGADDLLRGLARAVDDLGVACASLAVHVEPGKAEVEHAVVHPRA